MKKARSSAHRDLIRLQRKIFKLLEKEADRALGSTPAPIRRYARAFERDFRFGSPGRLKSLRKSELIGAVRRADVSLVADFHTFSQAQRTLIRICREAVRPGEEWLIGLEMVSSRHQRALDRYQEGRLSLTGFLKEIGYEEEWGFPWKNYAPIFEWARENSVRLVALNRPREMGDPLLLRGATVRRIASDNELDSRDQWAAGLITDIFEQYRSKRRKLRMIVLYGELHVARAHLPAQLEKVSGRFLDRPLSSVTIHQNHEGLYWALAESQREHHTGIVQLRDRAYCVLSSTPWTKLQSLVSWAEGLPEGPAERPPEDPAEESPDHLSAFRHTGEVIAGFLGLPKPSYSAVTLHTIDQADFIQKLDPRAFAPGELALIRFLVENNRRLFLPGQGILYLASPNPNALAELAAMHLYDSIAETRRFFTPIRDEAFRLVLQSAFGFLGSLLINPRRKCDLLKDHQERLRALATGETQAFQLEKESRILALEFLKPSGRPGPMIDRYLASRRLHPALLIGCALGGQVLGRRAYDALLSGRIIPDDLRTLALPCRDPKTPGFEARHERFMARIRRSKIATSKTETL